MSLGTAGFVTPASAAPSQETASSSVSISNSVMGPADEGPSPRFGFNSVLNQAATAITKLICPSPNNCANGTTTATVNPGQTVSFFITVQNIQNPTNFVIVDSWQAGLSPAGGDVSCTAGVSPFAVGFVPPSGFASESCFPVAGTTSATTLNFTVSPSATPGSTILNQACVASGPTTFTTCSTVTLTVAAVTSTPTTTATPTRTNTPTATPTVGAPPTPPASGTPGLNCANTISQVCTAGGGVSFSWTKTGSGPFTATATGPANSLVGAQPTIFIPTTANANGESFLCNATTAALTTSCS